MQLFTLQCAAISALSTEIVFSTVARSNSRAAKKSHWSFLNCTENYVTTVRQPKAKLKSYRNYSSKLVVTIGKTFSNEKLPTSNLLKIFFRLSIIWRILTLNSAEGLYFNTDYLRNFLSSIAAFQGFSENLVKKHNTFSFFGHFFPKFMLTPLSVSIATIMFECYEYR